MSVYDSHDVERDAEGFIILRPKENSRFITTIARYSATTDKSDRKKKSSSDMKKVLEEFRAGKLPKDSDEYIYRLVDIYGNEEIQNMSEVDIGEYVFGKGTVYSMNMNIGRNIPWIEDGLKPVERRALYVMWKNRLWGKRTTKVSSVVGEMINHVYPHGERAPADTIYRLGRGKSMMIPYIQELSNYGSVKDFIPAAARYADTSLSDYAYDCFFYETGPRRPLYDEKDNYKYDEMEPIYLTSRYPNILMQWSLGISKGAMSQIAAFNSIDIFKTTMLLMDNPKAKVDIYPDTPTPVEIINKSDLKGCFDKANFKVEMRAPYHLEIDKRMNGTRIEDKYCLVFTALPVGVSGVQVRDSIVKKKLEENKSSDKKFAEVLNVELIADDSPGGIQVIIEYVRGYDPHVLAQKLYAATPLAKSFAINNKLVINNRIVDTAPRDILLAWINQRYDQKRRYYHQLVLTAAKTRTIKEAEVKVIGTKESMQKAIDIISSSKNDEERIRRLRAEFGFTELQARIIGEIKLKQLQKMDVDDTIRQRDKAIEDYKHYRKLLSSDEAIKDDVRNELKEGMKKYGKVHIAKVLNGKNELEDPTIKKWVFYNHEYYFCTDDKSDLKKIIGKIGADYRMVRVRNNEQVLIFDKYGILKVLNGYSFNPTLDGISMNIFGVKDVVTIIPDRSEDTDYDSVVMITEMGYGKQMELSEVTKSVKSRIINLNADDYLADVIPFKSGHNPDSIIGMIQGDQMYYLRVTDFPKYKRSSAGNKMIRNVEKLHITRGVYLDATDSADYMLVYSESGYVKIIDTAYLAFSKRGNNIIALRGKDILGAVLLHGSEDEVKIFNDSGKVHIRVQVGKSVVFTNLDTGESKKFQMSTSIGSPTKVLKMTKSDWYTILHPEK